MTRDLVEKLGGNVTAYCFVVELGFLGGRKVLGEARVESLVNYDRGPSPQASSRAP